MTNPFTGPFPRSYWVREGQLLAGPFPASQLDRLAQAGVTAIINLTEPHEGDYTGYLPAQITHYRRPVMDFATPDRAQIAALLDEIDALLAQGETVYVHCWAGIGRTGTIIGCWLVRHGMEGEAALELLHERRGRLPETVDQRDMVREWPGRNAASADEVAFIEASTAAEAARKAEEARIARQVQYYRRATITFGVLFLLALVVVIYAIIQTQEAQNDRDVAVTEQAIARVYQATVQREATYFALEQGRLATLAAGGVILPATEGTRIPAEFVATLTQIAALNKHAPLIKPDEYGVDMVLVPAGCFWMGSTFEVTEVPIHEICFEEAFWIDKTEVTRSTYAECVAVGSCEEVAANEYSSQSDQPINYVTWFNARSYCDWREARLPTEAEWEYAARGPDSLIYPWGNEFEQDNVVYHKSSKRNETAPVGSRPGGASWVGALDMSGNMWEWVSSIYEFYPYDEDDGREDDEDTSSARMSRGGSWLSPPGFQRTSNRDLHTPSTRHEYVGFRCARDAGPALGFAEDD